MMDSRVAAGSPLLPTSLRKPAVAAIILSGAVFAALGVRVAGDSRAGPVDRAASTFVHAMLPLSLKHVRGLVEWGDAVPVIGAALALSALALVLGLHRAAALAILGPLITGIATTSMKPLVGRTMDDQFAYPSGHTGAWTALGIISALILVGTLSAGPLPAAVMLVCGGCGAGGAMAIAMVAAYAHYPSDTVGGFCTAVMTVLGVAMVLDRLPPPPIPDIRAARRG